MWTLFDYYVMPEHQCSSRSAGSVQLTTLLGKSFYIGLLYNFSQTLKIY